MDWLRRILMGDKFTIIDVEGGKKSRLDAYLGGFHGLLNVIASRLGPASKDQNIYTSLQEINSSIISGFAAVAAEIAKLQTPEPPPAPQLKGRFTLILKNDQPDFGYDFDVSGITDAEGEEITDPAVLAQVVKEVSSSNEGVVAATPPDEGGAGTIHIGTSGSADLSGKAWLSQADKDAGKDPAFLAVEPFTITTGDPAAITEGAFKFDIESGGTPAVE